jgi:peptidoglycan/LPS O-acetylase OafA/YrhL
MDIGGATGGRVPGLDGLRAISILTVMCGHFFLGDRGGFAALGVYIFFVISGFLITRLMFAELSKTGRMNIANFYKRRILRLFPVLLVFMFAVSLVQIYKGGNIPISELGSVFLYYTNYLETYNSFTGHSLVLPIGAFWSLSVEEHFYLIMPLFFVIVGGRTKPMAWFAVLACVVPLIVRCAYVAVWPQIMYQLVTYRNSETRLDSIAFGVLVAVLCETRFGETVIRLLSSRWALMAGCALVASVFLPGQIFRETVRFSLISAGFVPLLCATVFGNDVRPLQFAMNTPVATWIGKLSYSLYIWHQGVHFFLELFKLPEMSGTETGLVRLFASFVCASASYYLVELPTLRWGRSVLRMG